jgi:RNA polymerase sigma-70 factor (ECF subfamily)
MLEGAICVDRGCPGMSEASLARRCEELRPRALKFASGMIADLARAEELVQEAFLRISAARGRFSPEPESIRRYLFRVIANLCIDELRRERAGDQALEAAGPLVRAKLAGRGGAPSAELERRERAAAVGRALGRLPADERAALLLRELEDQSYAQIAEAMETSVSDVNNLIHRARSRFADLMRPWME